MIVLPTVVTYLAYPGMVHMFMSLSNISFN
jgi:hypothetical protein